ncbi:toxin-antitoxin system YwqK family antitoxin [Flavobacterium procerum]|uniref:Toxin-antitoxin system YwqK family antitoxin n=1 Tax=Flavobacterium procerum TaxID=1455569 RepID=A0ABV6BPH9_9FLAO
MKISLYLIITIIFTSCIFKRTTPFKASPKGMAVINGGSYQYTDFPGEDIPGYGEISYIENFEEGGTRYGKIINGFKEGKWLIGNADFDKDENVVAKGKIYKEEYFKHGLRDSIFRQFDNDGKVVYETTFKMGTGLWKEFHSNGTLYFEMYTKDGYFTDTLRLHNNEGRVFAKRFYQKDTLVYYIGNNSCVKYRYTPNDSTFVEVDSYEAKDLKRGSLRNTLRYKTKKEFKDVFLVKVP